MGFVVKLDQCECKKVGLDEKSNDIVFYYLLFPANLEMPSSNVVNVSHVKVWGRLAAGSSFSKPSEVMITQDGSLVLSAPSESGKSHRLDHLNWTVEDVHSQAQKVLQGLNVCLLNLSIG